MAAAKTHINPAVLRWAREDAGLSLDDAAQKAGITGVKNRGQSERLEDWERGQDAPTQRQLERLAKVYYRPVLTFYLPEPPRQDETLPDFRTVGGRAVNADSPMLKALERRARAKQQEVLEILTDAGDELRRLSFIGSVTLPADVKTVVADIRQKLNFDLQQQRGLNDTAGLFENVRRRIETCGVFVLILGNLGSHHTNIEPEEFRGFALADPVAPFVIINSNDAKAARTFTLLHELAHLWLGESGISNISTFGNGDIEGGEIESFCNDVASEFLLPKTQLLEVWGRLEGQEIQGSIRDVANDFSVSRAAVANKLWRLGEIKENEWWTLYQSYQAEWRRARDRMREQGGGPTYYIYKRSQLGNALIQTVLGALDTGVVTYTRASRILGVSAKNFDGLRVQVG